MFTRCLCTERKHFPFSLCINRVEAWIPVLCNELSVSCHQLFWCSYFLLWPREASCWLQCPLDTVLLNTSYFFPRMFQVHVLLLFHLRNQPFPQGRQTCMHTYYTYIMHTSRFTRVNHIPPIILQPHTIPNLLLVRNLASSTLNILLNLFAKPSRPRNPPSFPLKIGYRYPCLSVPASLDRRVLTFGL